MKSLAITLLLSSSSAVNFKQHAEENSLVQVPRNSLDAIMEQEKDQDDSVYPPSAHVEMKDADKSESKPVHTSPKESGKVFEPKPAAKT